MKRHVILDTETTGVEREDRIVSVGIIEIIDRRRSARQNEWFCNPGRPCTPGAFGVHGLTDDFLRRQPTFAKQAAEIEEFIGDAQIIAHNAPFDRRFINKEFEILRRWPSSINWREIEYPPERWLDSLWVARRKYKGQPCGLDALCDRFGIDRTGRRFHGALKDCHLLAQVWERMNENEQTLLDFGEVPSFGEMTPQAIAALPEPGSIKPPPYRSRLTDEERERHTKFVNGLGEKSIWNDYR